MSKQPFLRHPLPLSHPASQPAFCPVARPFWDRIDHFIRQLAYLVLIISGAIWIYAILSTHVSDWSGVEEHEYEYSVVEGFFVQDAPPTEDVLPAVLPRLGLVDSSPSRWTYFRQAIKDLQSNAPPGTSFKVFYLQRHGQGFHNVAESKYGTKAWDEYWSKLYTDGNITWGPDPSLTTLGIDQARAVNAGWKDELTLALKNGDQSVPLPEVIWSSPLRRAADTLVWTYKDTAMNGTEGVRPMFKENLRESIGTHTCDARSTAFFLQTTYSNLQNPNNTLRFEFERGFKTHDLLWTPDGRESPEEQASRTRVVLGEIFSEKKDKTFISLVGHGGTILSFFEVVGHKRFIPPTGALIPVVVKAVSLKGH